jgi:hypothetical protein
MSDTQKELYSRAMNVISSLSFYSPLIILSSVFIFSMFTATVGKFGWFLLWCFVITCVRWIVYKPLATLDPRSICNTFIPNDYTYSTYILTFTMMYFILPMIMVSSQSNTNAMNYGVLGLFISYITLDLFVKKSLLCIPAFFSSIVLTNIVAGLFLGAILSLGMYSTTLKQYLYINEINSNREVCSTPSKQQFRCNVFKDGTLVSSSLS